MNTCSMPTFKKSVWNAESSGEGTSKYPKSGRHAQGGVGVIVHRNPELFTETPNINTRPPHPGGGGGRGRVFNRQRGGKKKKKKKKKIKKIKKIKKKKKKKKQPQTVGGRWFSPL